MKNKGGKKKKNVHFGGINFGAVSGDGVGYVQGNQQKYPSMPGTTTHHSNFSSYTTTAGYDGAQPPYHPRAYPCGGGGGVPPTQQSYSAWRNGVVEENIKTAIEKAQVARAAAAAACNDDDDDEEEEEEHKPPPKAEAEPKPKTVAVAVAAAADRRPPTAATATQPAAADGVAAGGYPPAAQFAGVGGGYPVQGYPKHHGVAAGGYPPPAQYGYYPPRHAGGGGGYPVQGYPEHHGHGGGYNYYGYVYGAPPQHMGMG